MAAEWEHLLPLVDALRASGNQPVYDGFHPTQGGWDCEMQQRLDLDLVRSLIGADDHANKITVKDDAVFCAHCWASITGPDYKA